MNRNDHHKQIHTLRITTIGNFMLEIQTIRATKFQQKKIYKLLMPGDDEKFIHTTLEKNF